MLINWPNAVTIGRVLLAFCCYWILLNVNVTDDAQANYICVFLTMVVIGGDYLDGQLARALQQSSKVGAWLDIAADRLVEICFWIMFSYLRWVNPWIPILFVTRGIFVDGIRSFAQQQGFSAFGQNSMMSNAWGVVLVSSRFSRVTYAACKALAFGLVTLSQHHRHLLALASGFVYAAAILCVFRGAPVLIDGMRFLKEDSNRIR